MPFTTLPSELRQMNLSHCIDDLVVDYLRSPSTGKVLSTAVKRLQSVSNDFRGDMALAMRPTGRRLRSRAQGAKARNAALVRTLAPCWVRAFRLCRRLSENEASYLTRTYLERAYDGAGALSTAIDDLAMSTQTSLITLSEWLRGHLESTRILFPHLRLVAEALEQTERLQTLGGMLLNGTIDQEECLSPTSLRFRAAANLG